MDKYTFYSKNDPNKESLGYTKANTKEGAINIFSKLKRLEINDFNKLFAVEIKEK